MNGSPADTTTSHRALAPGSHAGIAVLKGVVSGGPYSRTPPYPLDVLSPFLGATLALATSSGVLLVLHSRRFFVPTLLPFAGSALPSYGPHELHPGSHPFLFAQSPAAYPAIVVGSAWIAILVVSSLRLRRTFRMEHP